MHLLFIPLVTLGFWGWPNEHWTYKTEWSLLITYIHSPGKEDPKYHAVPYRVRLTGDWEPLQQHRGRQQLQEARAWFGRNNTSNKRFKPLCTYLDLLLKSWCKMLFHWLLLTCHSVLFSWKSLLIPVLWNLQVQERCWNGSNSSRLHGETLLKLS